MTDSYNSAAVNREELVKRRRTRPNPAVVASERSARAAEEMADLAEGSMPGVSSLPRRIANRRRATADKIRKERPNLISYGE